MKQTPENEFDVIIIGAGISGIGAAYYLQSQCASSTFTVLDSKPTHGGTWDTHKYPGVRSDSDLFTFGYQFKPWRGTPIASGEEILDYLGEVIDENSLSPRIQYQRELTAASWSSAEQKWSLTVAYPEVEGFLYSYCDEHREQNFEVYSSSYADGVFTMSPVRE